MQVAAEVGGGKTPEQCFNRWHAEYNQQVAVEQRRQQLLRQQHQQQQQEQWQGHHPSGEEGLHLLFENSRRFDSTR